ncbi:MAG TPA: hypothetical protein PLG41_23985 [Leptospiraceae bacterium]|nr:hypothetical protein [Leptospiraceae bacterium]
MESNSEKIKSDDGFRHIPTKEELAALSKEELDQYRDRFKEHLTQSFMSGAQMFKEHNEWLNRAIEESKLKYPDRYADVKYIDIEARPRGPLSQEQIDAILGPASEPTEKETE